MAFVRTESIEAAGVNWENFGKFIGGAVRFAAEVAVINRWQPLIENWTRMSDEGAFESIKAQVLSSPDPDLHQLDAVLLMMASGYGDDQVRRRLVKFYAMFKIAETFRYQALPPFPE